MLTNIMGIYAQGADTESDAQIINYPTIYDSSTDFRLQLDYVF